MYVLLQLCVYVLLLSELEVEFSFVSSVHTVSEGAGTVEVCVNKNVPTNAFSLPLNVRELEPNAEAEGMH